MLISWYRDSKNRSKQNSTQTEGTCDKTIECFRFLFESKWRKTFNWFGPDMLRGVSKFKHLQTFSIHRALSFRRQLSTKNLPTSAEVVIAGGGAIGTSIAYHLTRYGWKDVAVLEQGSLGCGTSWHAAGLVGTARKSYEGVQLGKYAVELFSALEKEYGVGFKNCGSLIVAKTDDRALTLKHLYNSIKEWGTECYLLSPKDTEKVNPLIRTDDIKISLWVPMDGVVNPTDVVQAYSKGAIQSGGAKIYEGVEVRNIITKNRHVTSVQTNGGEIKCDYFINAGGLWANQLGKRSNPAVEIPLQPCQHFYIVTKPMHVDSMMPVTRDHDSHLYTREWSGGLMAGGFEPNALPCFYEGVPEKFEFQLLEENWEQFGFLMDGILNRFPCIKDAEIRSFTNGPESFTPDGNPHVSFSKEFDNYMMVCAMNSNGIVGSPGYGRMAAELMTYKDSELWNPNHFDIRRLPPGSDNKFLKRESGPVVLTTRYALAYPHDTYKETCRNIMNSPVHALLDSQGAVWNQYHNWEIPSYFLTSGQSCAPPTFGKPSWLGNVQKEMKACIEAVGMTDLSSNSVFEIEGSCQESLRKFEKRLGIHRHGDNVDIRNKNGRCIALVNISLDDKRMLVRTNVSEHNFLLSWLLEANTEENENVRICDVTGNHCIFKIIGPYAGNLLNELLSPPYTIEDYGSWKDKSVNLGYACDVKISPSTLGSSNQQGSWDLVVPTKYSHGLYKLLMGHGEKHGITNVGHIAMEGLRVQEMLPALQHEISMRSRKENVDVILKPSSIKDTSTPSLCKLRIELTNNDNWLWGGESIYLQSSATMHQSESKKIGSLSSIGYSVKEDYVLYALSVIETGINIGDRITIKSGLDVYHGEICDKR